MGGDPTGAGPSDLVACCPPPGDCGLYDRRAMSDPASAASDPSRALDAPQRRRSRRLRALVGWLVLAAAAAVAVPVVAARWEAVAGAGGLPGVGPAAAAVSAYLAGNVVLVRNWRAVVGLGGGRLAWRTALWVWSASQLARYTFSLAHVGGRAALGRVHGLTVTTGALSTVVELGWMLAVSSALALATVPWWLPVGGDELAWLGVLAVLPPLAVVAVIAAPGWLLAGAERVAGSRVGAALVRGRLDGLAGRVALRRRDAGAITAWYALNTALRHTAFVALFLGIGAPVGEVPAAVGALAIGQLAGTLAITPAGLGAREGVTAAVLTPVVGGGPALLLVASQRLLEIVAELALLAVARLGRGRG